MSYKKLSDDELIALLKESDGEAYTQIYDRYSSFLHTHAYKKLGDREEAKDVVQELFTSLWVQRDTIVFKISLAGYLYRAVRNRVLNVIAHKHVESKYIGSLNQFITAGNYVTDSMVLERELTIRIEKEVGALPPKMREVFELSRKANLSHHEIAERLEISQLTVRTHVKNALRILRVRLG